MSKDKHPCIFLCQMEAIECVYYPSNIFFRRPHFGRPFLKAFKRQRKSVSAQNISLLKVFSFIHFNNLLRIKAKRANVSRRVSKLGNITWEYHLIFPSFGCIT